MLNLFGTEIIQYPRSLMISSLPETDSLQHNKQQKYPTKLSAVVLWIDNYYESLRNIQLVKTIRKAVILWKIKQNYFCIMLFFRVGHWALEIKPNYSQLKSSMSLLWYDLLSEALKFLSGWIMVEYIFSFSIHEILWIVFHIPQKSYLLK